jgi:hypothetical protein
MNRFRNTCIVLFVAAIPAAAPPFSAAPGLCFTAGSITYRLSAGAAAPDYRVRIDNGAAKPDVRVGLVDDAEVADFALVDDGANANADACAGAGVLRTVQVVAAGQPADLTISLSRDADQADFTLYVHSARLSHADAAALFALMRRIENSRHALRR